MPELEQRLAELSAAIEWPATPDISGRVIANLGLSAPRVPRLVETRWGWEGWSTRNRWGLGVAAALLIVATLLAYTPSREAIASWVNLHVLIQRTEHPPTPSPLPSGRLGQKLGLGQPVTLGQAQSDVAWRIASPASLGQPDAVYFQAPPDGPAQGEVSLVYAARPGIPVAGQTGVSILITEARGRVDQNFFGKMLGSGATLEQVTVAGHQAYWIAGQPSVFFFIDAAGNFRNETMRLAANTLILDDNGTIVRIEGNMTLAQATAIATSMA